MKSHNNVQDQYDNQVFADAYMKAEAVRNERLKPVDHQAEALKRNRMSVEEFRKALKTYGKGKI